MRPELCPRFESCSAAVCPLDGFTQGVHLAKERSCFYLRALAKGKTDLIPRSIRQPVVQGFHHVLNAVQGRKTTLHRLQEQLKLAREFGLQEFKVL